jgi:hypothetical protein
VLSRFLKVKNTSDSESFHLLKDAIFSDFPVTWATRGDQFTLNQVRIKTNNNRVFAAAPLFFQTGFTEAHHTLEPMFAHEIILLRSDNRLGVLFHIYTGVDGHDFDV